MSFIKEVYKMQQKKIQSVVDAMLAQLKNYGAADSTISTYRDSFCAPIIRYFKREGSDYYSQDLLDSYLSVYKAKLDSGRIGETYYSITARIVRILKTVAETGTADFSRLKSSRRFEPSPEHLALTEQIIEANHVSHGAVRELHTDIRHFFCFIEEKGIDTPDITDEVFYDFIRSVSASNKGSMQVIMRAVRLISSYLRENGSARLQTDFSLLPMKYAAVHMVPPYSQEEISKIVTAIDASTPMGKRDLAVMLLAFDTGLRGVDIIKLRLEDIDWKAGLVSIRQSKTGHPITQALKGSVMNAVADYILEARPQNGEREVFLSLRPPHKAFTGSFSLDTMIEKYCRLAGVEKKPGRSFYSVRRAFATELSLKGVPLGEISELLGHRQVRSDKPYLSYDRNQISFCAAGFSEIPITKGLYAGVFQTQSEGGER